MKVLFLDIDGVIKPYNSVYDYINYDEKVIKQLSEKHNIDYFKYDKWEVFSAYYFWKYEAIVRLKKILEETNSKIIISSDWRDTKLLYKMRDLLKIYDLDRYWLSDNINLKIRHIMSIDYIKKRALEIDYSLYKYNIKKYVVVDDIKELEKYFPNNFVATYNYLTDENMEKCIKILNR